MYNQNFQQQGNFNGQQGGGFNGGQQQGNFNGQQGQRPDYNKVVNWRLICNHARPTQNGGLFLSCGALVGRKDKQTGLYPKSRLWVEVFIGQNTNCPNIQNWEGMEFAVNGTFSMSEWTNQQGVTNPQYTIFADSINIIQQRQRNNAQQGGGYNRPQSGFNGGQPQQNFGGGQQGGGFNGGGQYNGQQGQPFGQQGAPQQNFGGAPQQNFGGQPQQNFGGGQPQQNFGGGQQGGGLPDFSAFTGGVGDDGVPF